MAIVAKKKAGVLPHGGVPGNRALPLAGAAVLLALAAVVAWRLATARSESPHHLADETPAPSAEVLQGAAPSEPISARSESSHHLASEPPAPTAGGLATAQTADSAAARSESSPHLSGDTPVSPVAPALPEPPAPAENADGKQPIFDNPVEDNLESISRHNFESIVTLRVDLPQEEIIEILKRPVEIYDDDDEATVAAKERTADMKRAALDYIEAGGTMNQFLRDCQAEANEARETVKDVREEMKRILEAEGVEAAQAYLDGQNPKLREQGLEEVHIGAGLIRAMERRKALHAEQGK